MQIPIFPLNGAVLFPKTNLPLNIFEERYIEMIDYSLSNKRIIGMIQSDNKGELFKTGCVGKITNFNETKDGRYLINLEGVDCFLLKKEIQSKFKFRMVEASIIKNLDIKTFANEKIKEEILSKYKIYIKNNKIELSINELKRLNTEQLSKLIAMVSPFDNVDKQMLLEISKPDDFCNKLLSILEIELANYKKEKTIN